MKKHLKKTTGKNAGKKTSRKFAKENPRQFQETERRYSQWKKTNPLTKKTMKI